MKSHSASYIQQIIDGAENPFHTIEALGQHVGMCWHVLAHDGIEVWEADEKGHKHRPKGTPGTMVYHLRAIDTYQSNLFQAMAALLPELYSASEGDIEALSRVKTWLEELRDFHERRYTAFK